MAVSVRKITGSFRIIELDSKRIAKTKNGKSLDGGGHKTKAKAIRQADHINTYKSK